ncbi:unnamed protein product [Urochloa decumbens]|uniref:Disease resistance N-terminal domain-containing protein n=1 Tax=Urochloa decumbens TaxID=240449 RepID=A0ABC8Z9W0_9POAL
MFSILVYSVVGDFYHVNQGLKGLGLWEGSIGPLAMEGLLSAVASDLVGRLVSFLISKFQEQPGSIGDDVIRLQRSLLRARVVVEEAEARQVTNQAMLQQLNQLRGDMCRGVYMLDAFTRRAVEPTRRRSHTTAASRLLGLQRGSDATGELSVLVLSMEAKLSNMKEFVVLLGACPRVARQPYSAYLYMERCMFGRQMEKEQVISFLVQPARALEVLPVIGPHEVGKRTLVEHVCLDESVRERFAKIHRLCSDDLDVQSQEPLQPSIHSAERSLFVVDLAGGDKDEERWRGFLSSVRHRTHGESKIIIISRTEAHSDLGTVPPLRLRALRREELWYFFKVVAFGGADPEQRPELVRIAMALFAGILDSASIPDLTPFATVNKFAASLRADLSVRSWRHVLRVFAGVTVQLGAGEPWIYYPRVHMNGAPDAPGLFYNSRKSTSIARSELPKVMMLEVGHGVLPSGEKRFDMLVWQSRIPPYTSYIVTCDMERAAQMEISKKRLLNKRRRDQSVCGSSEDKVGR